MFGFKQSMVQAVALLSWTLSYYTFDSLILWCFFTTLLSAAVVLAITTYDHDYWKNRGVFSPPAWPVVGHILSVVRFKEQGGMCFKRIYETYRNVRFLGTHQFFQRTLVICDPALIKRICVNDFQHFVDRGFFFNKDVDPLAGSVLFLRGNEWRRLRAKISPIFSPIKLRGMFPLIDTTAKDFVVRIKELLDAKYKDESKENGLNNVDKNNFSSGIVKTNNIENSSEIIKDKHDIDLDITIKENRMNKEHVQEIVNVSNIPSNHYKILIEVNQNNDLNKYTNGYGKDQNKDMSTNKNNTMIEKYKHITGKENTADGKDDTDKVLETENKIIPDINKIKEAHVYRKIAPNSKDSIENDVTKQINNKTVSEITNKIKEKNIIKTVDKLNGIKEEVNSKILEEFNKIKEDIHNSEIISAAVDSEKLVGGYTADAIVPCAFGLKSNVMYNDNDPFALALQAFYEMSLFNIFEKTMRQFWPAFVLFFRMRIIPKKTHEFFYNIVTSVLRAREYGEQEKRGDFIDMMMALRSDDYNNNNKTDDDVEITDMVISANAFIIFLGGFETTSSTLAFLFLELAAHPRVQETMREEILRVVEKHDGKISYELLQELSYMEMVIQETLRLYPPFPSIQRMCTKDYTLPGTSVVVERGTIVLFPTLGIQRDEQYFENGKAFIPERWCEGSPQPPPGVYMPFGDGPRYCIGKRFAMIQMKCCLVRLLQRVRISPARADMLAERLAEPFAADPRSPLTLHPADSHVKLSLL